MEFQDYYAVLGVPRTANEKRIRTAYRKLARGDPGQTLAESAPAGLQWIGLYGTVFGGADWGWHLFIGLDSYGAID